MIEGIGKQNKQTGKSKFLIQRGDGKPTVSECFRFPKSSVFIEPPSGLKISIFHGTVFLKFPASRRGKRLSRVGLFSDLVLDCSRSVPFFSPAFPHLAHPISAVGGPN